ncbi:MAG: hypothetical protein RKP20_11770, partial [Candidatus Competibacter sp.]|nr:hypothetical protein [Candidatus Competibacter sp.]
RCAFGDLQVQVRHRRSRLGQVADRYGRLDGVGERRAVLVAPLRSEVAGLELPNGVPTRQGRNP